MTIPDIIPLALAVLCEDCSMITTSRDSCCACGSFAVVNLSRLIAGDFVPMMPELPQGNR